MLVQIVHYYIVFAGGISGDLRTLLKDALKQAAQKITVIYLKDFCIKLWKGSRQLKNLQVQIKILYKKYK